MCQLLGMNCAQATDFSFSFRGFCRRGGATDVHAHGFGLVVYEGRGVRSFHDTLPACQSPIAKLIQQYPIRTKNMIAHIRFATTGGVKMENVHPFSRELWGIQWTFAHNGQVPKYDDTTQLEDQPLLGKTSVDDIHFSPIGETDSEAVFCAILNAMKAEFNQLPTLPVLHSFLSNLCHEIIEGREGSTIFNFLLGCGPYTMFAYSWPGKRPHSDVWNGLFYLVREQPFSTAQLIDVDYSIDFSKVTTAHDRVAVITTKPLTDEPGWQEIQRGQLLMFDNGVPYKTSQCCEHVEKEGRGLCTSYFKRRRGQNPACSDTMSMSSSTASLLEEESFPKCAPPSDLSDMSTQSQPQILSLLQTESSGDSHSMAQIHAKCWHQKG